jgi:hypothetical protein
MGGFSAIQTGADVASKAPPPKLSSSQLEAKVRKQFPELIPYLAVPELKAVILQGAQENWTEDRFLAAVRGSNWWKSHTNTQQEWTTLPPAEQKQRIGNTQSQMQEYYLHLYGKDKKIDPSRLAWQAKQIASGALTYEQWQASALMGALKDKKSLASINQAEEEASAHRLQQRPEEISEELYVKARQDFWVPMSKGDALKWAQKINSGTISESDFTDYLRKQAAALYPAFAKQIKAGADPNNLFAPYANVAAEELQVSPQDLVMNDRVFGQVFQSASDGKFPSMADFRKKIRTLPEWQQTEGARKIASDGALSILNTFGKVAV